MGFTPRPFQRPAPNRASLRPDGSLRGPLMLLLRRVLRLPGKVWKTVRRRPRLTLMLLAFLLVASSVASLWGYGVYQWRAAQVALKEGRPKEARERLVVCLRVWPRNVE